MANFKTQITLVKGVKWENGVRGSVLLIIALGRVGKQAS